jgi:alpha-1,2-mannosyltransferase
MGLWALAAASLLASPVSWHNYLTILGPGVLLLLARGRTAPGCLLLALGTIPLQYASLWDGEATVLDKVALSLYTIILIAYWFAFIPIGPNRRPKTAEEPLEKDSRPAATSPYFD